MVLPNPEVSDQKKESSNTKTPTSPKNVAGGGPQRAKAQPENQVDSLFLPGVSSKVYLGKANPWRELGFPIGLLVFGVLFAFATSGSTLKTGMKDNFKIIRGMMTKQLEDSYTRRGGASAPNCTMYYAKSSIPGAGKGVFAGRSYEEGEIVFPQGDFLPASLHEPNDVLLIQQYAFLLTHHHLLANLEGKTFTKASSVNNPEDFAVRASKPIKAGDELFLPYSLHPKSQLGENSPLFNNIPGSDDFALADEIIQEEVYRLKRNKREATKGKDVETTLNLVYQTARKFSPKVAQFLPLKKTELDELTKSPPNSETFGFDVLKNKTVNALMMNAYCLSYTKPEDKSSSIVTTKKISKGSVVMPAPLLLLLLSSSTSSSIDDTCNDDGVVGQCLAKDQESSEATQEYITWPVAAKSLCLGHADVPFLLCPLSEAAKIANVGTEYNEENAPNVEYKWNKDNAHNKKSHSLPVDEVAKLYTTHLQMDVVALRDIEKGEQLRINLGGGRATATIPDGLIPAPWKKR